MTKIFMEHIPRTIFGVKFNVKCAGGMIMNRYEQFVTKNQQLEAFNKYKSDSEYSEVKMIRWHINANDEV